MRQRRVWPRRTHLFQHHPTRARTTGREMGVDHKRLDQLGRACAGVCVDEGPAQSSESENIEFGSEMVCAPRVRVDSAVGVLLQ